MVNGRIYGGNLPYDDGDGGLVVSAFIVRGTEVAFSLVSSTNTFGSWYIESGTPAMLENGEYIAKNLRATSSTRQATLDIIFRIVHEQPGESIEISGFVREGSVEFVFSGELDSNYLA